MGNGITRTGRLRQDVRDQPSAPHRMFPLWGWVVVVYFSCSQKRTQGRIREAMTHGVGVGCCCGWLLFAAYSISQEGARNKGVKGVKEPKSQRAKEHLSPFHEQRCSFYKNVKGAKG